MEAFVKQVYNAVKRRERDFQRKTYENYGIKQPTMSREIRQQIKRMFPSMQIITNAQWERQWIRTRDLAIRGIDFKRTTFWMMRTDLGGTAKNNVGVLPRSQAWVLGKFAQVTPKPDGIILDPMFPVIDGLQLITADDASYSGTQLSSAARHVAKSVQRSDPISMNKRLRVDWWIIIPFIHKTSIDNVRAQFESAPFDKTVTMKKKELHIKSRFFHIVVHFPGRWIHETRKETKYPPRINFPNFILEFKVAGESSIGPTATKEIRKIYNPKPIYKQDKVDIIPPKLKMDPFKEFQIGRPLLKKNKNIRVGLL